MTRNNPIKLLLTGLLIFVLLFSALPKGEAYASGPSVFINEIHYDNTGTDTGEAVEIAGPAGTDLTDWSIALYNGKATQLNVYSTINLSGIIPDQQNGYGTLAFTKAGIQNGSPDGLALVDDSGSVVQFLSYEGSFTAVDGPAAGEVSVDIGVSEPYSTPVGDSLQLTGVGTIYDDFTWVSATQSTFDAINNNQTFGSPSEPFINEIHYDNTGTDTGEAVEIAGPAGTDLTDWSIALYNGKATQLNVYSTINLSGIIPDQQNGYGTLAFTKAGIQNGSPDGLALVDDSGSVVQFLSYEGSFTAVDGPAAGEVSVDIGVSEPYSTPVGDSLQLTGVGTIYDDFTWASATQSTFDAINNDQTFGSAPPVVLTPIYDIQYTADPSGDSPLKNQTDVTTEGIVTAIFSGGYFIEDSAGGPWNGLWVYDSSAPTIGDHLRLTGTVSEYYGLTQMKSLTAYSVQSIGNPVPGPNVVATGTVSQEQWEGVLVKVERATVTNLDPGYGEWSVSDGSGDVVIDDKGSYTYTPTLGDPLAYVIGALDFSYGSFKIQPRDDFDIKLSLCGNPATLIHDVQGDGSASPLVGTSGVAIEGVVVGDFQTSAHLRGFFLQEEDGDADVDPMTSEGIFVYDGSIPAVDVTIGDIVRVTGKVTEYYGLTELTYISDIEVCGAGTASEATVALPVSSLNGWEPYEGMLIHIPQTLYATDNYSQGHYGEVGLSVYDRLDTPTNVVAPGAPAIAMQVQNDLSRIQLDDGKTASNPDPAPYIGVDNTLRAGDTISGITGVLNYAFGTYEIHPKGPVNFMRVNARDASPPSVGGSFKVASFNVLNYFTTLDGSGPICGPLSDQDCRGADSAAEFTRQRDKIVNAIVTMDADVIGLMEIENHPTDAALQDIVNGLNNVAGAGTYNYVSTGPVGTDAIKVAFIYKPASVIPEGTYAVLDSSVDPTFIDTKNRPALAQTFTHTTGEVFTAVVNHLKSKGSTCDAIGDPDTGDGQGNCNLTRTAAAEALVDWLSTDPTNSGDADFLIIGDLNAYAKEDPVSAIKAGGYTNLVETFTGIGAYSYVYYGQAGCLDHALATADLTSRVEGITIWHVNADEPAALDYNNYNQGYLYDPGPYRASDHDPVIVGICESVPPELSVEVTPDELWPANHKYVTVSARVDVYDASGYTTLTLLSVTSSELDDEPGDGDGSTVDDIVIIDDYTFQLRAERSATNKDGRVYTITYQAEDACGNLTVESVTVLVPFSQKK